MDTEPETPARSGLSPVLWIMAAVALLVGEAVLLTPRQPSAPPGATAAATSDIGGPFTLTAPDGRPFTLADLKGKPFAIYFGFTRCPDVCPTSLSRLATLRKALGPAGDKFAIVFVSVDPGHDKPATVGEYVKLFGTPMVGLTGSEAQLAPVEKAYGVYVAKVPQPGGDYTIDHSAAILLMDARAHMVDAITHDDPQADALAKLKTLVG